MFGCPITCEWKNFFETIEQFLIKFKHSDVSGLMRGIAGLAPICPPLIGHGADYQGRKAAGQISRSAFVRARRAISDPAPQPMPERETAPARGHWNRHLGTFVVIEGRRVNNIAAAGGCRARWSHTRDGGAAGCRGRLVRFALTAEHGLGKALLLA